MPVFEPPEWLREFLVAVREAAFLEDRWFRPDEGWWVYADLSLCDVNRLLWETAERSGLLDRIEAGWSADVLFHNTCLLLRTERRDYDWTDAKIAREAQERARAPG